MMSFMQPRRARELPRPIWLTSNAASNGTRRTSRPSGILGRERTGLIAAKDEVVVAKLAAEVKTAEALKRVGERLARLSEVEKLACIEEELFTSWR